MGAATITFMELFASIIAVIYLIISFITLPGTNFSVFASTLFAWTCRMRSAYSVPASPSFAAWSMIFTSPRICFITRSFVVFPRTLS